MHSSEHYDRYYLCGFASTYNGHSDWWSGSLVQSRRFFHLNTALKRFAVGVLANLMSG